MVAQSTDGLSHGDLDASVMWGSPMLDFIPFHLRAFQCSLGLLCWIQTWSPGLHLLPLKPYDCFVWGYGITADSFNCDGVWIPTTTVLNHTILLWTPSPAAPSPVVAIEELSILQHKQPFFMYPCLFNHKVVDLTFFLHPGHHEDSWPMEVATTDFTVVIFMLNVVCSCNGRSDLGLVGPMC